MELASLIYQSHPQIQGSHHSPPQTWHPSPAKTQLSSFQSPWQSILKMSRSSSVVFVYAISSALPIFSRPEVATLLPSLQPLEWLTRVCTLLPPLKDPTNHTTRLKPERKTFIAILWEKKHLKTKTDYITCVWHFALRRHSDQLFKAFPSLFVLL